MNCMRLRGPSDTLSSQLGVTRLLRHILVRSDLLAGFSAVCPGTQSGLPVIWLLHFQQGFFQSGICSCSKDYIGMATVGFVKQTEFRFQPGNRLKACKPFSSAQRFCVLVTCMQKMLCLLKAFNVSQVRRSNGSNLLYSYSWHLLPMYVCVPTCTWEVLDGNENSRNLKKAIIFHDFPIQWPCMPPEKQSIFKI